MAVGDPGPFDNPAVGEDLRVGAAVSNASMILVPGPAALLQLGQRRGKGGGQAGRLAGDKADRAAALIIRALLTGLAPVQGTK
jgi:hypothetical protein